MYRYFTDKQTYTYNDILQELVTFVTLLHMVPAQTKRFCVWRDTSSVMEHCITMARNRLFMDYFSLCDFLKQDKLLHSCNMQYDIS